MFLNELPQTQLQFLKVKVVTGAFLDDEKVLLAAEKKESSQFNFGFYEYDLGLKTLKNLTVITKDKNSCFSELLLKYYGKFYSNDRHVIYITSRSSNYWILDKAKMKLKSFITKDKTPLPIILNNGKNYYFETGTTFNTNSAILMKDKTFFVFSYRNTENNRTILD